MITNANGNGNAHKEWINPNSNKHHDASANAGHGHGPSIAINEVEDKLAKLKATIEAKKKKLVEKQLKAKDNKNSMAAGAGVEGRSGSGGIASNGGFRMASTKAAAAP
eukprot:scaffold5474_cov133-Chaetoceros_neogracile.AAC.1